MDVEPEAFEVDGNGNLHHELFGMGSTVKLVPGNGHHTDGNGHDNEPDQPQRTPLL